MRKCRMLAPFLGVAALMLSGLGRSAGSPWYPAPRGQMPRSLTLEPTIAPAAPMRRPPMRPASATTTSGAPALGHTADRKASKVRFDHLKDGLDAFEKEQDFKRWARRAREQTADADPRAAESKSRTKSICEECEIDANWVDVSTQPFDNRVGGRVFWDLVEFAGQSPENIAFYGDAPNYTQFRSLRPAFYGDGWGVYEYLLELEFARLPDVDPFPLLIQAWLGIRDVPYLGFVQIGKQRVPGGLENYTSQKFITFLEYSLPTNVFVPGFRAGVLQSNQCFNDTLLLQNGVFYGEPLLVAKQFVSDEQGVRFSTRAVWTPVYALGGRSVLHLGADWEYSSAPTRRFLEFPDTRAGVRFLDPGLYRLDSSNLGIIEFFAMNGPLFVQSEIHAVAYEGLSFGVGHAKAYGAYAQVGYFLTGEHRGYNRATGAPARTPPLTHFWLVDACHGVDAGWGAWEIALRWDFVDLSQLAYDNEERTFGTLHDITLGVNWYWNPNMRVMFNYVHAMPRARRGLGEYVSSNADILGLRFQFDW